MFLKLQTKVTLQGALRQCQWREACIYFDMTEKKPLPPRDERQPEPAEPPEPEAEEPGQSTIFNVPPSHFERLVDEVLKKHKI
jgi:hypothetical protein